MGDRDRKRVKADGQCSCLRNVVTLFQYIEKEKAWRREKGRPEGFEALVGKKPIGGLGLDEVL